MLDTLQGERDKQATQEYLLLTDGAALHYENELTSLLVIMTRRLIRKLILIFPMELSRNDPETCKKLK